MKKFQLLMNKTMLYKTTELILASALILSCAACGKKLESDVSPIMVARYILSWQTDCPEVTVLTAASEDFSSYLTNIYGLDEASVEDGVILSPTGAQAQEIAVFRMIDADAAETAQSALDYYITQRHGAFAGYAPDQAFLLEGAETVTCDRYALLLICEDAATTASHAIKSLSRN